ncbi:MAG: FimV/HubP family polar landmark protein [Pseudomonadota bacterium]
MDRVGIRALVAAASCLPSATLALGLGNIEVNSRLNQRLDARIELVGATAADLEQLTAALASREVFASQGVDYPSSFATIDIQARRDVRGRAILHLTSRQSIVEPIATLVVQADWRRGRMQRAYTILLDPPGLGSERTPAPPLTAGVTPSAVVAAPRRDPVTVPPAATALQMTREPVRAASSREPIEPGIEYGPVARGESLWKIAVRVRGDGVSLEQTMESIYLANPQAFAGSMDRLGAGALLRIPAAVATSKAQAAAKPQTPAGTTRSSVASPAEQEALFDSAQGQLAAPATSPSDGLLSAVSRQIASTRASNAELNEEIDALNSRFASTAALLQRREAELDRLRGELSSLQQDRVGQAPGQLGIESATASRTVPSLVDAAEAAAIESTLPDSAPSSLRGSLLSGVAGAALWFTLGALAVGLTRLRRRPAVETASAVGDRMRATQVTPTEVATAAALEVGPMPIENDTVAPPALSLPASAEGRVPHAAQPAQHGLQSVEEEGPVDAVAEADILLAYGLHTQASDLVQAALVREPRSLSLKAKLLEVYFAANKPNDFAQAARAYQASLREHATFWRGALAMGRQLCPREALFATGSTTGRASVEAPTADPFVDFDLGEPDELPLSDDFPTVRAKIVSDEEVAAAQLAAASQASEDEEATARVEGPEFAIDGLDTLPEEQIADPTIRSRTLAVDTVTLAAEVAAAQQASDSTDTSISSTDILHGVDDPLRGIPAEQAFGATADEETVRVERAASTDATTLRITMDRLARGVVEETYDSRRADPRAASDGASNDTRPKRASSE